MIHRIALTGAQGTGKSSLATALADRLSAAGRQVALYGGLGDAVAGDGFVTGALASAPSVRAFARLHRAREASATGSIQIFDRSLLDTLAYARVLACLEPPEYEELRQATIESCSRLTRLLWLRVVTDYPVQGPSDETPGFRREIDATIGRLARENGISLVQHAIPPDRIDDIVAGLLAVLTGR